MWVAKHATARRTRSTEQEQGRRGANLAGVTESPNIVALTGELDVANAVLHGSGLDRFHFRVVGDGVRVEVTDNEPSAPVVGGADDDAPTGHGLLLVGHLAERWGIDVMPAGKVVWAEVTGRPGTGV